MEQGDEADMSFKLESLITENRVVLMQLKADGCIVGFASFGLDVAREFMASMLILKDKLNDAGMINVEDSEIIPIPSQGANTWN